MVFRSHSVLSLLVLSAPTLSFAADIFNQLPQIFDEAPALSDLQTAYQAVHHDPYVRELLEDGNTNALSISQRVHGLGIETTKFQHYYKGLEVMGSMTFHHANTQGTQIRNLINRFDLDTRPGLTRDAAVSIAKSVAGDLPVTHAPELKILPAQYQDSARLVYWVDLDNLGYSRPGAEVIIDAQTGQLIANISKLETLAPVQVLTAKDQGLTVLPVLQKDPVTEKYVLSSCTIKDLDAGTTRSVSVAQCKSIVRGQDEASEGKCQIVLLDDEISGSPLAVDPSSCKQVVTRGVAAPEADSSALNALSNSNQVLSYYHDVHGRDGFDDAGSEVVSIVHAGLQYGNAAWVKGLDFMMYGDGDGELMGDMTRGLDVAGHELTHGITSKTAKLTMMDQAGALNEAYSDFFGKMIAKDGSWIIGESLSLDRAKFPGIRHLADPKAFKSTVRDATGAKVSKTYPVKASEAEKKLPTTTCDSNNDRCWVHFNSTVPSHASYLIYNAIGPEKTQALYYLTLTQYLNSEANFTKAAQATLAACQAKFDSATCDQVRDIFVQSEMLAD
jgi:bacillolysin